MALAHKMMALLKGLIHQRLIENRETDSVRNKDTFEGIKIRVLAATMSNIVHAVIRHSAYSAGH